MTVTAPMIERLKSAMEEKGVRKKDLAEAVGLGPSWVTKLLSGELHVLKPAHRFAMEDLLGIDLMDPAESDGAPAAEETYSAEALQFATLMDRSNEVYDLGRLLLKMLKTESWKIDSTHLPPFSKQEYNEIAKNVIQVVAEAGDDPLDVIGEDIIAAIAWILDGTQIKGASHNSLTAKKHDFLQHCGGVDAGEECPMLSSRYWPLTRRKYPGDHFILRAYGDAMEPVIPNRSDIVIKPYRKGQNVEPESIMVVRNHEGIYLAQFYLQKPGPRDYALVDGMMEMFRFKLKDSPTTSFLIPDDIQRPLLNEILGTFVGFA